MKTAKEFFELNLVTNFLSSVVKMKGNKNLLLAYEQNKKIS